MFGDIICIRQSDFFAGESEAILKEGLLLCKTVGDIQGDSHVQTAEYCTRSPDKATERVNSAKSQAILHRGSCCWCSLHLRASPQPPSHHQIKMHAGLPEAKLSLGLMGEEDKEKPFG